MTIIVRDPGEVLFGGRVLRCALGRGGIGTKAGEGDGITPAGLYPLRSAFYRPDRLDRPKTGLPTIPLLHTDGWCDDPGHADYNRQVRTPFGASHEKMWREDALYDVVVVLGFNDDPVRSGLGSAIFMHVAKPKYEPTEGCVALALMDLLDVLEGCSADSQIEIMSPAP